jgi:hypothetical protein
MSEKALNRPENFQGSKESYGIPGILALKKVIMGTIGKGVLLNLGLALLQRSNRTRIHRTIRTLENRKLK